MKKLLAYSLGAIAISALPIVVHAQFTLPMLQQNQAMIAPPLPMYQPPPQPMQLNQQTFGNQTFYNGTAEARASTATRRPSATRPSPTCRGERSVD